MINLSNLTPEMVFKKYMHFCIMNSHREGETILDLAGYRTYFLYCYGDELSFLRGLDRTNLALIYTKIPS